MHLSVVVMNYWGLSYSALLVVAISRVFMVRGLRKVSVVLDGSWGLATTYSLSYNFTFIPPNRT